MNRKDFFFRQKLKESELDAAFDEAEIADRNIMVDLGMVGVISNGVVTEESPTPDLTVDVSGAMIGRTPLGERLFFGSTLNVDLSKDGDLPVGSGGTGDGVTTAVGSGGNERWVSIFLIADRILADPRTDGLGATVFFDRFESFHFTIVKSAELAAPIAIGNAPVTPAGAIRLADVRFAFGTTQIFNADIDVTNRNTVVFKSVGFEPTDDVRGVTLSVSQAPRVSKGQTLGTVARVSAAGALVGTNDVNVASIVDNGTGDHTINFDRAHTDVNYIIHSNLIGGGAGEIAIGTVTATSVQIFTFDSSGVATDREFNLSTIGVLV